VLQWRAEDGAMHFYLACFDISDDRVRDRVGKALAEYGERVQRSVFEVAVDSEGELAQLRSRVRDLLEEGDDCRFYCLCKACRARSVDSAGQRVACPPAAVVI
jgi:CRISPR-associated protein Cas2